MFKKILIQTSLFILIILISLFFFTKYFKKESSEIENETISNLNQNTKNSILELSYESKDNEVRKHSISALSRNLDTEDHNLGTIQNVSAKIILIDGNIVSIISDNAKYNSITSNTDFENNVKIKFLNHKIDCDFVKINFEKNILEAFNNLTYENIDLIMNADKIIIDLNSKDTKIFNLDEKKIKIKKK